MPDPNLTGPASTRPAIDAPSDEAVAEFLRAHPNFLAERPELYRALSPPRRVHGEEMADHMAAMLRAEREHAESMTARASSVLAAGRAAAGMTARVHEAALALLRMVRPNGDVADCVALELPALLGVDAAALCIEMPDLFTRADPEFRDGPRALPDGAVERLLGGRAVAFRARDEMAARDARMLHGEASGLARTDALVRVPGAGRPALLALVARDDAALDPVQGAGALAFLGRAVAAALGR